MKTTLTGAGLLAGALLLGGGAARAGLIDYTAGGVNLVFDNDYGTTGLTWLKNANLADTVDFGVSGIASDGAMSWAVAQSWITAMNAANYAGTNGWRLWSALNSDGSGPCSGYNCTGSELGHLFYTEGGLTQGQSITSSTVLTQHFTNMQSSVYWSGTEYSPYPPLRVELLHRRRGPVRRRQGQPVLRLGRASRTSRRRPATRDGPADGTGLDGARCDATRAASDFGYSVIRVPDLIKAVL